MGSRARVASAVLVSYLYLLCLAEVDDRRFFFFFSTNKTPHYSSMAFTVNPRDESAISFAIYKPTDGHDIDEAVAEVKALVSSAERAGDLRAVILKSVNGSWVAVFTAWKLGATNVVGDFSKGKGKGKGEDDSSGVIRVVDSGFFQMITEEHRADYSIGRLSVGDIVSVRRIYTEIENQEVFAYSCLAVLKAYFAAMEGFFSCTFYKSKDGKMIIGLGIWDGADSASALLDSRKGSPGEAYWKDLGAKNLKYEVCQVVHITNQISPNKCVLRDSQSPPDFQR